MEPTKAIKLDANYLEQLHALALEQNFITKERIARTLMRLKKESTTRLHVKNYTTVLQLLLRICEQYEEDVIFSETALNTFLLNIKSVILDLLNFLNQRFPSFLPDSHHLPVEDRTVSTKVYSKLSVDQLALILRAAFDQGMIISKSMNNLFRSIVPYLSTTERSQLSFSSMRSKSYNAENKDKSDTIAILQELIKLISSY